MLRERYQADHDVFRTSGHAFLGRSDVEIKGYLAACLSVAARSLRFADRPDEVHTRSLGRVEIARRVGTRP